jgi:small GTP-binding protein
LFVIVGENSLYTIGLVGIDNAGKTTIMEIFTKKQLSKTVPTVGINLDQMSFSFIDFSLGILDFGGQSNFRLLWVDYINTVDAIIYVIDASDHERLQESLNEFNRMLNLSEHRPRPILVLANKADLPNTMPADFIKQRIEEISEISNRDWSVIETSAITTQGLVPMMNWVYEKLTGKEIPVTIDIKKIAKKKFYYPCPLLKEMSDGDYCLNHNGFNPVKVFQLKDLFQGELVDIQGFIQQTKEEMKDNSIGVCFNSVFTTDEDELIHCATDESLIEVEGVTANAAEYEESQNMMHLTGGEMCSDCLYKILFSAIRRRINLGSQLTKEEIEKVKQKEAK